MLEILTPTTVEAIEASLAKVAVHKGPVCVRIDQGAIQQRVSLPLYESAYVNWIISLWHKMESGSTFVLVDERATREPRQRFALSLPGVILGMLPHGKVEDVDRRATARFREDYFASQASWPDLAASAATALVCNDAFPDRFPASLYDGYKVADWETFRATVGKILSSILAAESIRGRLLNRLDALSTILFELFKNTDEHARTWINGDLLGSSCRGILARYYATAELQDLMSRAEDDGIDQAKAYTRGLLRATEPSEYRMRTPLGLDGLVEITVFDSGPGLAQRWLRGPIDHVSPSDQYHAVLSCFHKGSSSAPDRARGFGLWKVLRSLRELSGFISVRTDAIHVYRDFFQHKDYKLVRMPGGDSVPKEALFDWRKGATEAVSEVAPCRGALVSIILPLLDK